MTSDNPPKFTGRQRASLALLTDPPPFGSGPTLYPAPVAPFACKVFTPREMAARLRAIRRRIRRECPGAIGDHRGRTGNQRRDDS